MGIFEKELVLYLLGWLFRWISSNEKNRQKKAEIDQKKKVKL